MNQLKKNVDKIFLRIQFFQIHELAVGQEDINNTLSPGIHNNSFLDSDPNDGNHNILNILYKKMKMRGINIKVLSSYF